MSEIFNPNYNDLPTQVEVNRRNIEELKKYAKDAYTTIMDYGDTTGYPILSVPLTSTNLPQDTDVGAFSGFMITKDSVLTNIINVDYEYIEDVQTKIVNASYVCSLRGPKGDTGAPGQSIVGPQGPPGPAGDPGDQIYVAEYVPSTPSGVGSIANIPWSSTNVPVDTQNVPDSIILAGNGWFYHIDGYVTSSDTTGYDLVCSAVADVKGPKGDTGEPGESIVGPQGPQGIQGPAGVTPNITMGASVTNTTGTPTVSVFKQGTAENPSFTLAFENLKGATGPQGEKGDDAVTLTIGTVTEGSPADASLTSDGNGNYTLDLTIPSGGGGSALAYEVTKASDTFTNQVSGSYNPNGNVLMQVDNCIYAKDTGAYDISSLASEVNTLVGEDVFNPINLWCDGQTLYYFDCVYDPNDMASNWQAYFGWDDSAQGWRNISTYVSNRDGSTELSDFWLRGASIYSVGGGHFIMIDPDLQDMFEDNFFYYITPGAFEYQFAPAITYLSGLIYNGVQRDRVAYTTMVNINSQLYYIDVINHVQYIRRVTLEFSDPSDYQPLLYFSATNEGELFAENIIPRDLIMGCGKMYYLDRTNHIFYKIANAGINSQTVFHNMTAMNVSIKFNACRIDPNLVSGVTLANLTDINTYFIVNGEIYADITLRVNVDDEIVSTRTLFKIIDDNMGNIALMQSNIWYNETSDALRMTETDTLPFEAGSYTMQIDGKTYSIPYNQTDDMYIALELYNRVR